MKTNDKNNNVNKNKEHIINYGNIDNDISDDKRPYRVYCHIAPNGKLYIGQTYQTLEGRYRGGSGYNHCPHINSAIIKYGWDNFKHIELISGLSKEMADIVEIELIKKYNTTNDEFGYNVAYGGALASSTRKAYQYDMDGNFIKSYQSLQIAAQNFNVSRLRPYVYLYDDIFHSCGYLWTLNYYGSKINNDILDTVLWRISTHGSQKKCREVFQYDENYKLIQVYKSVKDAMEKTGIDQLFIKNACLRYKVYDGFIWSYDELDDDLISKYESILKCDPKIIHQYSSDGELVNTFMTQTEAAQSIGKNHSCGVSGCCMGDILVSHGYIWSYEELSKEEVINRFYKNKLMHSKKKAEEYWNKYKEYLNDEKEN